MFNEFNVSISALSAIWSRDAIRRLVKSTRNPVIHLRTRRTTKSRYVPRCLGAGDVEFFNFLSPRDLVFRESLDTGLISEFPDARARPDKSCSHLDDLWNFRASRQRMAISNSHGRRSVLDEGTVFIVLTTMRELIS